MDQDQIFNQAVRANVIKNIKNSGIPLSQLAKKADVSVSTLRAIVSGKTIHIKTLTAIKICTALNMNMNEFLDIESLKQSNLLTKHN